MNKNLEQQILIAMAEAEKKPRVSLPWREGIKITKNHKSIMEVAKRLADK